MTTRRRPRRAQYEEELVHLAVPATYLPHIAKLIVELDQMPRPIAKPAQSAKDVPDVPPANWPVEQLRAFSRGRTLTHRTMFTVLDVLAEHPDEEMKVADVATAAGVSLDKVIGALAGLTRLVKSRHDYAVLRLPLDRIQARRPVAGWMCIFA